MKFKFVLLILCCFHGIFISCKKKTTSKQPLVTVTILPQKYFIEQIAGDFLQVNVMVPPGMNPATCDLHISQLQKLHNSDLCFSIGHLPFEQTHLYPVLQQQKNVQLINHSEGVQLLHGNCNCTHTNHDAHLHQGVDPHIWLSLQQVRRMSSQIYETLTKRYPEEKKQFQKNYHHFLATIDSLIQQANETFQKPSQRSFLIYHPSLSYFAADYDLEQIAIEDEGKEPNPTHLKQIIDIAKEKKIQMIFIQSQFDTQNAQTIARAIHARIIPIDPLAENWLEEMKKLIYLFKQQ